MSWISPAEGWPPSAQAVWEQKLSDTSEFLTFAGRYEQAAEAAKRALELDPGFPLAHYVLGAAYAAQQMYPQAIAEYQKMLATDNGNTWARAGMARAYAEMGQRADAERLLAETLESCGNRGDCSLETASIYVSLGEKDQAFAWLEKAYQDREGGLILLNAAMPTALRDDPRYADLLRRIGLSSNDGKVAERALHGLPEK